MPPEVEVEVIKVVSRREDRLARIAESQRQGVEIAAKRSRLVKANKEKYGTKKR